MSKRTGFIASAVSVLTFGMAAANAEETPKILGAADYQAMSSSEMSNVIGERRVSVRIRINNTNNNTNVNQQQQAQCLALCAGGNLPIVVPPPNNTDRGF